MKLSSLRIAFVSDAITSRNGVGTYYQDLVSHLSEHVERAELIAPRTGQGDSHQGLSWPLPGDATQRIYFPRFGKVPGLLDEIRPHVVVFPTLGPYTFSGIRYARKRRIPIGVGRHTDFESLVRLYYNRFAAAICQPILRRLSSNAINASCVIVTNSMADKEKLTGIGKVHLVGTPISRIFMQPTAPLRKRLGSILFLGRLGPEKNVDKLVDVARQRPDVKVVIGGDGPLRSMIQRRAAELTNLEYRGWLERKDVVRTIDEVDLLVLPSRLESFGSVALEAMCRGRNVLVSRNCGIRSWPTLADKLFYWEEGETLSEAIERVSQVDHSLRLAKANDGRLAAMDLNASTLNDWISVFESMIERKLPKVATVNKMPAEQHAG